MIKCKGNIFLKFMFDLRDLLRSSVTSAIITPWLLVIIAISCDTYEDVSVKDENNLRLSATLCMGSYWYRDGWLFHCVLDTQDIACCLTFVMCDFFINKEMFHSILEFD